MFQKFICCILLYFGGIALTQAIEVINSDESCMVSLSIPKESIKAVCAGGDNQGYYSQQKFKSIESQLAAIRREMNELHISLTKTLTYSNQAKTVEDLSSRMTTLETNVIPKMEEIVTDLQKHQNEKKSFDQNDIKFTLVDLFGKNFLERQVRNQIRKEMIDIKQKVKLEIHSEVIQEVKEAIRSELLSYTKQDSKLFHGINTEILLNIISDFDPKEFERANNLRKRMLHSDPYGKSSPYQEKRVTDDEFEDLSAINNEVPEKPWQHAQQDDSQASLEVNSAVELLQKEVKKYIDEQTKKVKEIVAKHLNYTESVCQNVTDGIERKYEKKFKSLKEDLSQNEQYQNRFDEMDNNIRMIVQGLNSLRENRDEIKAKYELEKENFESQISSALAKSSNNFQLEIDHLKNQTNIIAKLTQATAELQRITQAGIQNFNATFKLRNHYIEENITRMAREIKELNKTINPDYGDSFDIKEAVHQLDVEDTVNFVKEFKNVWPEALQNLSALSLIHLQTVETADRNFENVNIKFNSVVNNQTYLNESIHKLQQEVKQLQEIIAYNEKIEREAALERNEWAKFDFNMSYGRSECFGDKKYVKKTGYKVGVYVGVVLCSPTRYKIYLSDSLNETFLDIGDNNQSGEDHCEFVGATQQSNITIKRGDHLFDNIPGYKRADWGQVPVKSTLYFFSPTPVWYECGVKIP